jgi:hypothetical protein
MKLSDYRIATGHYRVGEFTIYGCYPRWQLRDENDDLLDDFATLRDAIGHARMLSMNSALAKMDEILSKPAIVELINN